MTRHLRHIRISDSERCRKVTEPISTRRCYSFTGLLGLVTLLLLASCSSSRNITLERAGPTSFFSDINSRGQHQVHEVFVGDRSPLLGVGIFCDTDTCRWLGANQARYSMAHSDIRAIRFHSRTDAFIRNIRDYTATGAAIGAGLGFLSVPASADPDEVGLSPGLRWIGGSILIAANLAFLPSTFAWLIDGADPDDAGYTGFIFPSAPGGFSDSLRFRYRYVP